MQWPALISFVAVALVASQATSGADRAPAKQLTINVRILEGDPLGKQTTGTLKVLADTRLVTVEHRPFSLVSGAENAVDGVAGKEIIPTGRLLEGKGHVMQNGKVRLDITLSSTTMTRQTEECDEFRTASTRTITTVRPGEVLKLRWGKGSAERQAWAEISVAGVNP